MVVNIIVILTMIAVSGDAVKTPTLSVNIKLVELKTLTCTTNAKILTDNEEAYIYFQTKESYIKELKVKCTSSLNPSRVLNMTFSSKQNDKVQYRIQKVTPDMHGRWECKPLYFFQGSCNIDIRVQGALSIQINNVVQAIQIKSSHKKWIVKYYYYENELADVSCSSSVIGDMAFELKDKKINITMADTLKINALMRFSKNGLKYIYCYHNTSGVDSVVQIALKPRNTDSSDDNRIKVDGQIWSPRPEMLTYRYISGEIYNVSCDEIIRVEDVNKWALINLPAVQGGSYDYVSTDQRKNCPDSTVEFTHLDTKGIQGLSSSNIIVWYTNSDNYDYLEIHYKFEDNENINLTWTHPDGDNEFTCSVSLEEAKKQSVLYNDKCIVRKKIPSITPEEADRSVITFKKFDGYRAISIIKIIPHLTTLRNKEHLYGIGSGNDIFTFYLPAAVLTCVLTIIVTAVILYKKKKRISNLIQSNPAEDNNYEHLYEEIEIPPFPAQWDEYATILERTEPDMKSIRDLYAKPIPKSERMPKLNETYSTVSDPSVIEDDKVLYHEIQF